jgi:pantetheine-phosphate adenylyltransferase
MKKIALFPGSFDPFTRGHENIISRALPLFDQIVIAIGRNSTKGNFFSLEKRMAMISYLYRDEPKIKVDYFDGLTVEYCNKVGATHILRGLRTSSDFEYERAIAQTNRKLNPHIETVFLLTTPELTPINSTIVREVIRHGGDYSLFLPEGINPDDF